MSSASITLLHFSDLSVLKRTSTFFLRSLLVLLKSAGVLYWSPLVLIVVNVLGYLRHYRTLVKVTVTFAERCWMLNKHLDESDRKRACEILLAVCFYTISWVGNFDWQDLSPPLSSPRLLGLIDGLMVSTGEIGSWLLYLEKILDPSPSSISRNCESSGGLTRDRGEKEESESQSQNT